MTGNAIVRGNFFPTAKNFDHYAIGAPKANELQGRVYICYKCFHQTRYDQYENVQAKFQKSDVIVQLDPQESQTGARFGETLAAADIDGDGVDDLIVGAPLFCEKVLDEFPKQ